MVRPLAYVCLVYGLIGLDSCELGIVLALVVYEP